MAESTHALAHLFVRQQIQYLFRQVRQSFLLAYKDASWADTRPSVRSNCTMGFPRAMYSMILFIVDKSFIALATSGFTQTSAVLSISSRSRVVLGR